MFALPLYFASHWELVIAVVILIIGLVATSFFLKNWKWGVAAGAVAVAGFLYQGAVTDGIKEQMAKDALEQTETLTNRIAVLSDIAGKHALQTKADDELIDGLEDDASETPKNDGPCLGRDAVSRVRSIGANAKPRPTTAGPGRYPKLFSKGSR
jgi:hypothetical protein